MAQLNVNFSDIETEYPVLKPGIYEAQITDVVQQEIETSRGTARVLDFQLRTTHADEADNEDSVGLTLTDRYFLDNLQDNDQRKWKRMILSSGQEPPTDGWDPETVRDSIVRVRIRMRKSKNSDREFPSVADYLPPDNPTN